MKREDILKSPAYWFEHEQNELYRQVVEYMERENINRTELADRLNVHKSYVSQILNGNFNYTLKKWIELCLFIGVVPNGYKKIEDIFKEDAQFAQAKKEIFDKKIQIQSKDNIVKFRPVNTPTCTCDPWVASKRYNLSYEISTPIKIMTA